MDRRLAFFLALLLPVACTIFNGLTPPSADGGGADSAKGDAGAADSACSDGAVCAQGQGLCSPQATCSSVAPCDHGVIFTADGGGQDQEIQVALVTPVCKSLVPPAQDEVLMWADKHGATRAACVYDPPGTGAKPLVVFFHPWGGSADDVYYLTTLRTVAPTTSLGDGPGFVLAADQGLNLVSVDGVHPPGPEHDFYYRDYDSNPDFEAADYLIDTLVVMDDVDTSRIYVMGMDEGAFFAEEYAIIRNVSPTPGGHRVAAAAVFEGGDPFQSPKTSDVGCALTPYPKSSVHIDLVHRACSDVVGCDSDQEAEFALPPGYDVYDWANTLRMTIGVNPEDHVINDFGGSSVCATTTACTPSVAELPATRNWPGDWQRSMLEFLAKYTTD
jgi:pimeloyl-ACP methyl ester carboxylesterase